MNSNDVNIANRYFIQNTVLQKFQTQNSYFLKITETIKEIKPMMKCDINEWYTHLKFNVKVTKGS